MCPLKQRVEALGMEINRLWAELKGAAAPPLVPLPSHDGNRDARPRPAWDGPPKRELRTDGTPSPPLQVNKTTKLNRGKR
jgi:hypothetical protein